MEKNKSDYYDTYMVYSDGRRELIKAPKRHLDLCGNCGKEFLKTSLMYHNRLKTRVCDDCFGKHRLLTREERKQEIILEKKQKEEAKLRSLKEKEEFERNSLKRKLELQNKIDKFLQLKEKYRNMSDEELKALGLLED